MALVATTINVAGSSGNPTTFNISGALSATGTITGANILSGTYTPILTNVANLAASTAYDGCVWLRVGNAVTVSCYFELDPSTNIRTRVGISLPVASNFTTTTQGAGVGGSFGDISPQGGALTTDVTNNRMEYEYLASTAANAGHTVTFTYRVL